MNKLKIAHHDIEIIVYSFQTVFNIFQNAIELKKKSNILYN